MLYWHKLNSDLNLIVQTGSLEKTFIPGMRVAFIAKPEEGSVAAKIVDAINSAILAKKAMNSLNSSLGNHDEETRRLLEDLSSNLTSRKEEILGEVLNEDLDKIEAACRELKLSATLENAIMIAETGKIPTIETEITLPQGTRVSVTARTRSRNTDRSVYQISINTPFGVQRIETHDAEIVKHIVLSSGRRDLNDLWFPIRDIQSEDLQPKQAEED